MASTLFDTVRSSCAWVARNATDCEVSLPDIDKFLSALVEDEFVKAISPSQPFVFGSQATATKIELNFSCVGAEINHMAVLDLLQFGSGYRKPLHQHCDLGASDIMNKGVAALHTHCGNIDAAILASVTLAQVNLHFGFNEEALKGPVGRLANMITQTLNETGKILQSHGYADFAALIKEACTTHSPPRAADMAQKLFEIIPAFHDVAMYHGHEVVLMKKVQLLAGDLYKRFCNELPAIFEFCDITNVTVFVDNVLPAVLRFFGVLRLSPKLLSAIETQDLEAKGELEVQLRAVSLYACELIIQRAPQVLPHGSPLSKLTTMDLDWFLWVVGKRPDIRKIERHVCQGTNLY